MELLSISVSCIGNANIYALRQTQLRSVFQLAVHDDIRNDLQLLVLLAD